MFCNALNIAEDSDNFGQVGYFKNSTTESFQAAKDLNIYLNVFVQGVSASWLCCEFRNLCLNRQHWISKC